MITVIIISAIFVVIGFVVMFGAIMFDLEGWVFKTGCIIAIISTTVTAVLGICHTIEQNSLKEYPASEYTFKIKVVEFEEQKDTILVVIPKEE